MWRLSAFFHNSTTIFRLKLPTSSSALACPPSCPPQIVVRSDSHSRTLVLSHSRTLALLHIPRPTSHISCRGAEAQRATKTRSVFFLKLRRLTHKEKHKKKFVMSPDMTNPYITVHKSQTSANPSKHFDVPCPSLAS